MHFSKGRTLLFFGVLFIFGGTNGYPTNITSYDQRQTGDLNIQISVKDLKIIALLGGGIGLPEDYDYNYDYAELTIKPTNLNKTTTAAPMTTTKKQTEDSSTENISTTMEKVVKITPPSPLLHPKPKPIIQLTQNIINLESGNKTNSSLTTQKPGNVSSGIPVQILTTPVEIVYNHKEVSSSTTLNPEVTPAAATGTTEGDKQADCIEGFRKDRRGNCRSKIRKPQQQTLLRKLIQISHRMQNRPNKRINATQ